MFKGIVRPINQFESYFDSADIDRDEYMHMKNNPQAYIKEQTLFLWNRWTLRNPDADYKKDVAVIPPFISDIVVEMVNSLSCPMFCNTSMNSKLISQLDMVDKYLFGHPHLLCKRLICFVVNADRDHWYGFCAIIPWICILKHLIGLDGKKMTPGLHPDYSKKRFELHQTGLFFNDALKCRSTKPEDVSVVFPFIWLLNMMSHYRDLLVSSQRPLINFVQAHTKDDYNALHMYFLGTHGPFGNLFYDNLSTLPFKFLDRPAKSIAFQPNGYDCGICWCLFIYDTMLSMHH
jgi:hypothetical protein